LAGTTAALAHGGEDHGAPPPPINTAVAPRASASSDEFEVVTVLADNKLLVYLDRFSSNEPVTGAKLEVEGAGLKGLAEETAPGIYTLAADDVPAAHHPLTLSIETSDSADLLTTTLDTTAGTSAVVHVHTWGERAIWLGAAVLALAGGALLLVRRRKQGHKK
jgi:LPXTG-motif cell wall-anchored protein